jgi:monoamine oxidase
MNNFSNTHAAFTETVIIVGAGAAGLMTAKELSGAGKKVVLLEAGVAAGGRIRTMRGGGFISPVEEGAEFVHGELPLTLQLLRSAGIPFHPVMGKMIHVRKGKWGGRGEVSEGWGELMKEMQKLTDDMPLSVFLSTRFPGEKYAVLRDSVRRMAQGFDLADIHTASTLALHREWSDDEGQQYRVEGGYGRMIDWLVAECQRQGVVIHFSAPVEKIDWAPGRVLLTVAGGQEYAGSRAIVTVSLGILQARTILFSPEIGDHLQAAGRMGYGSIVKILLQFTESFWSKKEKKLGFVISDEPVPTWWTQAPDDNPLLTGWLPGAGVEALQGIKENGILKEEELLQLCLSSLAGIFGIEASVLRERLVAVKIVDWSAEPFIRGGYSFETVENAAARRVLDQPVADTLYFAGEGLHEGYSPGTVEAALENGKRVAEKIIGPAVLPGLSSQIKK